MRKLASIAVCLAVSTCKTVQFDPRASDWCAGEKQIRNRSGHNLQYGRGEFSGFRPDLQDYLLTHKLTYERRCP